jgi:hypothetical protein
MMLRPEVDFQVGFTQDPLGQDFDASPLVSVKRLQADAAAKLPLIETGILTPKGENGMDTTYGSMPTGLYKPLVSPRYFRDHKVTEIASTGVQMKIAHRYLNKDATNDEADLSKSPVPKKRTSLAPAASTNIESARGHESPIVMVRNLVNNQRRNLDKLR